MTKGTDFLENLVVHILSIMLRSVVRLFGYEPTARALTSFACRGGRDEVTRQSTLPSRLEKCSQGTPGARVGFCPRQPKLYHKCYFVNTYLFVGAVVSTFFVLILFRVSGLCFWVVLARNSFILNDCVGPDACTPFRNTLSDVPVRG